MVFILHVEVHPSDSQVTEWGIAVGEKQLQILLQRTQQRDAELSRVGQPGPGLWSSSASALHVKAIYLDLGFSKNKLRQSLRASQNTG